MPHSFATNSEDILWVSNMLGHKHSSMTLKNMHDILVKKTEKEPRFYPWLNSF